MTAALCVSGCSLAVNADRVQCSQDSDCTAHHLSKCVDSVCQAATVTPEAGRMKDASLTTNKDAGPVVKEAGLSSDAAAEEELLWGCMDRPRVTNPAPGPFKFTFHLAGILDPTPIAGATALLCRKLDPTCMAPVAGPLTTDAMGNVSFMIDKAFTGYVSFAKGTDMTPGLYFFNPPPDHDMDAVAVQVVTPALVSALTGSFKSPQKDENGLTLINVLDCNGKNASGVSIVGEGVDPMATEFYSVGGIPTSAAMATATEGYGGFVNLPPVPLTVHGAILGTKRELSTISVLIRAGSITYARLAPLGR